MPTDIRVSIFGFNVFLHFCAIVSPIIWISVYLLSTYTAGDNIFSGSISETALRNHSMRIWVVISTGVSTVLSSFITICRVIQIRVVYEERSLYQGVWRLLNRLGATLNIIGHCCLFLMALFVDGTLHLALAVLGVMFMLVFTLLSGILTVKERLVLYQYCGESFFVDAIVQGLFAAISTIAGIFYIVLWLEDCSDKDDCDVRAAGNCAEWICFFAMNVVRSSFVITFSHDEQALLEIERWWALIVWELSGCFNSKRGGNVERQCKAMIQNVPPESNGHNPADTHL